MSLEIVLAYDRADEVRKLFAEYMDMLLEGDPTFAGYLTIQNYDDELKDFRDKYGLPDGRLYLAYWNGEAVGSIALRKIDKENCELKRMYVKPAFRRNGIAKTLIKQLIADAHDIGYRYMLLDTLPFLQTAIHMYKDIGFYEIERYNNSPMDTSIYMKLDLPSRE